MKVIQKRSKFVRMGFIVVFGLIAVFALWNSQRKALWKWRVRSQAKPAELLAWHSQVRSNSFSHIYISVIPWETLSNAPAYLTNIERVEAVLPMADYIYLSYGKGNDWGLVIGAAAFPSNAVLSHVVEMWAPEIYYWSK